MYMERKENLEKCSAEFLVLLSYLSKCEFEQFGMQGKVPFFTYVHIVCTFLIIHYDALAYGTAYLIRPTKSNDPASSLFGACYMASGQLSHC